MKVPLIFSSKNKELSRVFQDPNLDKETSIILPRMSFEHKAPIYDGARKLGTIGKIARKDPNNPNKFKYMYNPVPMIMPFTLHIYTKFDEDLAKISEQIYPFFTPEWNASVNIVPDVDIFDDIAIVYVGSTIEDQYEGEFTKRKVLIQSMEFNMKMNFYGPVRSKPIIKFSNENIHFGNPEENTDPVSILTVTPGMDANGNPTTIANNSVAANTIFVDDNWDYIFTKSGINIQET